MGRAFSPWLQVFRGSWAKGLGQQCPIYKAELLEADKAINRVRDDDQTPQSKG
jgi:hypothetical protein